jgi:hypothetical protein
MQGGDAHDLVEPELRGRRVRCATTGLGGAAMANRRTWWGRHRVLVLVTGAILLVLIAGRIALPSILEDYVNRKLDEIPEYDGHVGDIDVALIRGAYTIKDLELVKTNGKVKVPFVAADRLDLSVQWGALFEGSWVGELAFERAKLNFVKGRTRSQSQQSIDRSWLPTVDKLFPLRINKVSITEGEIHYQDLSRDPHVDVFIDSATVVATNLTNSKDMSESLFAVIEGEGLAMRHAPLKVHVETNPNAKQTTFDLNVSLRRLRLVELNDLVKAFGGIDFEKGAFAMDTELAASNGRIEGYVKPIFEDVKIVDLEDDSENPLQLLWETIVGAVGAVFTNQGEDQMATRIPISGSIDRPGTNVLAVIGGLVRNAFIEAIKPGVEGTVDLDKNESKEKQEAKKETQKEVKEKKGDEQG